jgi:FKBP-type peptidyl-prolyl cis-trans isomerase 2
MNHPAAGQDLRLAQKVKKVRIINLFRQKQEKKGANSTKFEGDNSNTHNATMNE